MPDHSPNCSCSSCSQRAFAELSVGHVRERLEADMPERVSAGPTFAAPGDDVVDYPALERAANRERRMRAASRMWR
jgi:hypothetical protein